MTNPLLDPENISGLLVFVTLVTGAVWSVVKWLDKRIDEKIKPIDARLSSSVSDIAGLDQLMNAKEIRLVKLELTMDNIVKSQERIEDKIDRHFLIVEKALKPRD